MSQVKSNASNLNGQQRAELPDPEVVATAQRRQFSTSNKNRLGSWAGRPGL